MLLLDTLICLKYHQTWNLSFDPSPEFTHSPLEEAVYLTSPQTAAIKGLLYLTSSTSLGAPGDVLCGKNPLHRYCGGQVISAAE